MKPIWVSVAIGMAMLLGCGGSSRPSGISKRAFVSNSYGGSTATAGVIQIVNTSNDVLSTTGITVGTYPGLMAVSPAKEVTIVLNTNDNTLSIITNSSEKVNSSTIQLPASTESLIAQNANVGYAAFRNINSGEVVVLDLENVALGNTLLIPRARRMVMNHAATKLLVFSDSYKPSLSGCSGSALTVLDISNGTSSTGVTTVCGFDEAVGGVFSADDSQAYIMNCGPECGTGSASASVALLDMTSNTVTSTVALPSAGATAGFLNGTTLYVAGTLNGTLGSGTLTTLGVSSGLSAPSAPVHISDGYHTLMALGANNKLFIGSATNCTNNPSSSTPSGCLTIYDTSAGTAVIDAAKGFVTGMAPIPNRSVVYVVEGGLLRIYDTTTTSESNTSSVNIIGQCVDVKLVDQ